jgi:hypothetical protein
MRLSDRGRPPAMVRRRGLSPGIRRRPFRIHHRRQRDRSRRRQTGAHRWTFRFHIDPKLTLPGARTFAWAFSDKVVAASYVRTDSADVPYAVVNAAGETLWVGRDQSAVYGPVVELSPGRVLIPQQGSGAILVSPWRMLYLDRIVALAPFE